MPFQGRNCWEFMKCGREPGGVNAVKQGVCPAAADPTFNGLNQGSNSGRFCWLVAGTFCKDKVQGTFAAKQKSCSNCAFYQQVQSEEGITRLSTGAANIFGISHIGLVRKTNQDRYLIQNLSDGSVLLAIADGLGGQVAGDYAAELIMGYLAGIRQIAAGREIEEWERLAKDIDASIYAEAMKDPDLEGMGSTLVGALLRNGYVYWVNVGDSRLYHLQNGRLTQVTEDQMFSRFLLNEGEITPEQALTHYSRLILDQCVGCGICEPEMGRIKIQSRDRLILSTDGLHDKVPEKAFLEILNGGSNIDVQARLLVDAALGEGGKDNITVVIAEIS